MVVYFLWISMKDKFLEWEDRIFSAPYKWFIKKGLIDTGGRLHAESPE